MSETRIKTIICVGDSYDVNKTYNAIVYENDKTKEFSAARQIFNYLKDHGFGDFTYTNDYFPMLKFSGGQRVNFFHDMANRKEAHIFLDYIKMRLNIDSHDKSKYNEIEKDASKSV